MKRRALISVSDKRGVVELAQALDALGYEVVSTGGTAKAIADAGVPVTPIEAITGFPEMMDGRVKTLHPNVHGGLLARRDVPEHVAAMQEHGIGAIDVVAVNLYPFRQTVAKANVTWDEAVENIDIGGPSMVRSAAKNHAFVSVVVDPDDYPALIAGLRAGTIDEAARRKLAQKAFAHTAAYDAAIASWLGGQLGVMDGDMTVALTKPDKLRYGENPHQAAWRYTDEAKVLVDAAPFRIHQGKELSYNNLVDADAAWSQFIGQVAAGSFEGCLHRPHHVVIRHDPVGAVVAHGEHGAAFRHQRRGEPGHTDEGMAGDVHRLGEALGGAFEQATAQILQGGKGDRVNQDIELAPTASDLIEDRLELAGNGDIEGHGDLRLEFARERFDVRPRLFVQPRHGHFRARGPEGLGAAVGNRLVVGDAHDQGSVSGQNRPHGVRHAFLR